MTVSSDPKHTARQNSKISNKYIVRANKWAVKDTP